MFTGLEYYSPWLVWIFPIVSSLFVPLAAKIGTRVRDSFVILAGTLTLALAISMIPSVYSGGPENHMSIGWIPMVDIELGVFLDPLSVLFTNLVAFMGLVVLVYSLGYMAHEQGLTRYYFLILLFMGSMIGLVIADNFLQLFMFWELVGLCSYALVSFWYDRPEAVKAGMKVFLMTKVGDIALLAGILLLYSNLHVLSFEQVFEKSATIAMPVLTVISLLMLFGAIVKSAQLPLHTWLYSAMEAPTSVSCLLHGATMVKGGVYLISRTHVIFCGIPVWLSSVAWIGAITALIGAILALHTPDIKGVPAYSTISQIGFMIAPLGVASSPEALGWFAGLFHMVSHAFFQGLGFLAIGSIVHQLGTRDMRKMGGLRREMPFTFVLCTVVILARSGIPPFCGFFSKGLVASSLLSSGNTVLTLLIYSAAAVTFAYSCRFLLLTFAGEKSRHLKEMTVHEAPRLMSISSGVLATGCIVLGFLGGLLASFLRVGFIFDLASFFGLESLTFVIALLIGGLPTYLVYQRRVISLRRLGEGSLAFLDNMLESGFYFDSAYTGISRGLVNLCNILREKVEVRLSVRFPLLVAGGISKLVYGIHRIIEVDNLERIPDIVASGVTRFAYGFYWVVELNDLERIPALFAIGAVKLANVVLRRFDNVLDELTYLTANMTASHSLRIRRLHSGALPHFVLAATIGFFFLCVLLLLTLYVG